MDRPLYLLLAYAKAQASDMSADEKKIVTALAAMIKAGSIKGGAQKEQKR